MADSRDFKEHNFHKNILDKDELVIFDKATDGNHLVLPKKWIRNVFLSFIGSLILWLVGIGWTAKAYDGRIISTVEKTLKLEKMADTEYITKEDANLQHDEIKVIALKSDSTIVILARADYTLFNNKLDNIVEAQQEANKLTKMLIKKALDK